MKKIAFYMHNFNGGGAEKVTITLADLLYKDSYDVSIIVKNNTGKLSTTVPTYIKVVDLNIINKTKISRNLSNVGELVKIFNSNDYDCIISVTRGMNLIASIARKLSFKTKIPLIGTIHNAVSQERINFSVLKNLITEKLNGQFSKMVVVSEDARQEYIKLSKIDSNKTVTIYNPVVSDSIFNRAQEECSHPWLSKQREFKTLVTAGRLTKQKNQILLLEMFKELVKATDSRLIILGEGELKEELEQYCLENNIREFVDFVGFVENPYSYFKNADAFVLSSIYEGLPTVLIEALACGCNVVSTDCPTGPREILQGDKFGYLCKVNDAADLLEKTLKCLKSPIPSDELVHYSMNFSTEKSKELYVELMRDVIYG